MEPRLNIKIAQIFEAAGMPVDNNFIGPDDQWVGDWIDRTEDYPDNMQAYMEQREGIALGRSVDADEEDVAFALHGDGIAHAPSVPQPGPGRGVGRKDSPRAGYFRARAGA
jgi:hypothetical protein